MAREITRLRNISYLNGDFDSFRRDLIKFADAHMSGVITDRSTPSTTMAMLELSAFIGDNLRLYVDQAFNELRADTARQLENVVAFAKQRGYKPTGKSPARGKIAWLVEVPASVNSFGEVVPDPSYTPTIMRGARVVSRSGVGFETLQDVDFIDPVGRDITGSLYDVNGLPTHFVMRKSVEAVAGTTKTEVVTIPEFKKFRSIELGESDVTEIMSVVDSDGNEWFEVDYLAQDWVFDSDTNENSDSSDVPYVLKVVAVPRRFIKEWNPITKKTSLIFGQGDGVSFDDELIPNIADYALPLFGKRTFTGGSIDPRNFLRTRSLGLSPYNTTLTIKYRYGGGPEGNIDPRTVTDVVNADIVFPVSNLDPLKKADVESSLQCINLERMEGGRAEETLTEIKLNAAAYFAAQDRVVTREDIVARVLSLPSKFGKPAKVYVRKDGSSPYSLDIHVLAYDSEGNLTTASSTLKSNIARYLEKYRMLTDGVNILDGTIINFRVNFGIVVSPKFNKSEVISRCIEALERYFRVENAQIGRPIVRSDVIAELQEVEGVISVYDLVFSNVVGGNDGLSYSPTKFDFVGSTRNGIIFCPEDSIFELKYYRRNIVGTAR